MPYDQMICDNRLIEFLRFGESLITWVKICRIEVNYKVWIGEY